MIAVFTGSIVVTIAIVFAVAAALQNQVNAKGGCPECGTPDSMFRNPTSVRQTLWGGWTCSVCGTEIDRQGNRLTASVRE
jgi:ribosomal protein L37AE/L43A